MKPISDLDTLLRTLSPELKQGTYAFATLKPGQTVDWGDVVAMVREAEGVSVVVEESMLPSLGLEAVFRCTWITLNVNSDLQAVGLTAAFAAALGNLGISCNVVAGTHHDHLFVPAHAAHRAMDALWALQQKAATDIKR